MYSPLPGVYSCDGVICDTEALHRQAYNAAFQAFGLTIDGQAVDWTVEYYVSAGASSPAGWGRRAMEGAARQGSWARDLSPR